MTAHIPTRQCAGCGARRPRALVHDVEVSRLLGGQADPQPFLGPEQHLLGQPERVAKGLAVLVVLHCQVVRKLGTRGRRGRGLCSLRVHSAGGQLGLGPLSGSQIISE